MVALATAFVRLRPEVDENEYGREGAKAGRIFGKAAATGYAREFTKAMKDQSAKLGQTIGEEFGKGFSEGASKRTRRSKVGPEKPRKDGEKAGEEFGEGFKEKSEEKTKKDPPGPPKEKSRKAGEEAGEEFGEGFNDKSEDKTKDAPVGPDESKSREGGEQSGGAFAEGFRRQLEQAARTLPTLNVDVASTAAQKAIQDVQDELRELSSKTVGVDLDAGAAIEQVQGLQQRLRDLATSSPDIQVRADTTAALSRLGAVLAEARKLDGKSYKVDIDADTGKATRSVSTLNATLAGGLGKLLSGLSGTASTFFTTLSQGAVQAGGQITTSVVGAAASAAGLTAATGGLNLVVGAAVTLFLAQTAAVVGLTAGFLALAPAVAVVGGLLGGAVSGIVGLAAGALTLKLGLGGVGEAYSSMVSAQHAATKSSASFAGAQNAIANASDQVKSALASQANTRANLAEAAKRAGEQVKAAQLSVAAAEREATRQVADAQRSLAQARQEATQQAQDGQARIVESIRRVRDAQQALTAAEAAALDVRKELTRAQQEAQRNLEDLASSAADNSLDERQAILDVAEARKRLDAVLKNKKSTQADADQAQLAYERQVKQLNDIRVRGKRLAADQAEANKKGVQGSDQVVEARKRIAEADKAIADARKGVKDAEDDVRKTQRDAERQRIAGVQRVAAAERAVADARVAGEERVAAAERTLAQARAAQSSQQRAAAYQLAQAAQSVVSAQRALGQASTQAGLAGGEALSTLNDQMAELSPNAQKLVRTLFGLRQPFQEIRRFVSERLLNGISDEVQTLADRGFPVLRTILGELAARLNVIGTGILKAFGDKRFLDNITIAARGFGDMLSRIGASIPGLIDAFGRIAASSTPVLRTLGNIIGKIFDKFSAWIKSADDTGTLDTFMKEAAETLQQIFDIGGQVLTIIGQLIGILFPQSKTASDGLLDNVQNNLDKISDWLADPENQQKIRDWIAKVGEIAKKAGEFVRKVDEEYIPKVQEWINKVSGWISTADTWIKRVKFWGTVIAATFTGMGAPVVAGWNYIRDKALNPMKNFFTGTLPAAGETLRTKVTTAFGGMRDKLTAASLAIRTGPLGQLSTSMTTTLPASFAAGRDKISARFGEIRDRLAAGWASIRDRTFGALRTAITTTVPNAFRTGADAIRAAWDKVRGYAREPVRFVIDTVLNKGLVAAYNKVAGVFPNVEAIKPFTLPKGFATGGVLPGYTPGRDVHRFTSASGGTLDLSGGEAVMRPEWTRAVGVQGVNAMNAAARSGGVAGVRRAMGGYASGGILPGGAGDGLGDLWKRIKGKASDVLTGARNIVADPTGSITGLVGKLIGLVPGGGSPWTKLVTAFPRKLLDTAVKSITGFLPGRTSGAGTSGPGNGKSPFGGSAGMMRALRSVFPGLPLISGYRRGSRTLSGNTSYHSADRAVDLPPREDVAKFIHDSYGNITKELITPYQKYNLHNGRPHTYTGAIWNQHNFAGGNAHDHWAAKLGGVMPRFKVFDNGGAWRPGTIGVNTSGRTEYVDRNADRVGMSDVADRLDQMIDLLAGLGVDIVEAQRVGSRRAGRLARGGAY